MPAAVATLDEEQRVAEWNPGAEELFGYSAAEASGRLLDELVAPPGTSAAEEARRFSQSVLQGEPILGIEVERYRKDRTPVDVLVSAAPIRSAGRVVGAVVTYKDLSEQNRARKDAEQLVTEKQLLLEEAYHRIKNDMLLVRSMLLLQSRRAEEEVAKEAIESAADRVGIIGEMYRSLYSGGGIGSVALSVVRQRCLDHLEAAGPVTFIGGATEANIAARPAVAVGIIINELVTNSLKHAIPEGDSGSALISVSLQGKGDDLLLLEVRDGGAGFPADILSGRRGGLGLDIVHALAEQYDGTLVLSNEPGAVARVALSVALSLPDDPSGCGAFS